MAYHSTVYTNKQIKKLLRTTGLSMDRFTLAHISGKPARTKNKVLMKGNKIIIYGSDFVAKGYLLK